VAIINLKTLTKVAKTKTANKTYPLICVQITASIIENPIFYKKYIHEKFETINSTDYLIEDVVAKGYIVISSMSGDCLCGSKN
jgi:hypothetical protein